MDQSAQAVMENSTQTWMLWPANEVQVGCKKATAATGKRRWPDLKTTHQ